MQILIGELCSKVFYQGMLKHHTSRHSEWKGYEKYRPLNILNVDGNENGNETGSSSFKNDDEVNEILKLLEELNVFWEDQKILRVSNPVFLQNTS